MYAFKLAAASVLVLVILAGAFIAYDNPRQLTTLMSASVRMVAPDPTADCNREIKEYAATTMDGFWDEWKDALYLADNSPRMSLAPQVAALQAIRRKAGDIKVTGCANNVHAALLVAMDGYIDGFLSFLANDPEKEVTAHFSGAATMMDIATGYVERANTD